MFLFNRYMNCLNQYELKVCSTTPINKMNNTKSMNKFYNIIMSNEYVQKRRGNEEATVPMHN